jgi:formamidopyrimidine-DNA glycosylase
MPELPEVEICRRLLSRNLTGAVVTGVETRDARVCLPSDLVGRRIVAVTRRAKFILARLDDDRGLLVHLGMTGWFETRQPTQYRWALCTSRGTVFMVDPRRFGRVGVVSMVEARRLFNALGPEPLGAGFNLDGRLDTRRPIKVALLDQRVLAGVGNISASEWLWRARIDPRRPANRLSKVERRRLQRGIVAALKRGIGFGSRIFTAPNQFHVYDRKDKPCHRCRTLVRRISQAGRSTYFCPACQA